MPKTISNVTSFRGREPNYKLWLLENNRYLHAGLLTKQSFEERPKQGASTNNDEEGCWTIRYANTSGNAQNANCEQ
jgi:hypothetical protein